MRSRQIRPGFFNNDALGELPPLTRLLFAGLWVLADKEGRLADRPKKIKAMVLPYDDWDIDSALNELSSGDDPFICRYEAAGRKFIQVLAWQRHQSPHHKETESEIPSMAQACSKHDSKKQKTNPCSIQVTSNKKQVTSNKSKKDDSPDLDKFEPAALRESVKDWLAYKRERREAYQPTGLRKFLTEVSNAANQHGVAAVRQSFEHCMACNWAGWRHGLADARGSPGGGYDRDAEIAKATRMVEEELYGNSQPKQGDQPLLRDVRS